MGAGGEGEDDTTTPQLTEAYTTVLLSRPSYMPVLACSRVSGPPELHVMQCALVRCVHPPACRMSESVGAASRTALSSARTGRVVQYSRGRVAAHHRPAWSMTGSRPPATSAVKNSFTLRSIELTFSISTWAGSAPSRALRALMRATMRGISSAQRPDSQSFWSSRPHGDMRRCADQSWHGGPPAHTSTGPLPKCRSSRAVVTSLGGERGVSGVVGRWRWKGTYLHVASLVEPAGVLQDSVLAVVGARDESCVRVDLDGDVVVHWQAGLP